MKWTHIEIKEGPNVTVKLSTGSWKQGTYECYITNRDCLNCDNFKFTGGFHAKCKIPFYVQALLNKGCLPPIQPQFNGGFQKQSSL